MRALQVACFWLRAAVAIVSCTARSMLTMPQSEGWCALASLHLRAGCLSSVAAQSPHAWWPCGLAADALRVLSTPLPRYATSICSFLPPARQWHLISARLAEDLHSCIMASTPSARPTSRCRATPETFYGRGRLARQAALHRARHTHWQAAPPGDNLHRAVHCVLRLLSSQLQHSGPCPSAARCHPGSCSGSSTRDGLPGAVAGQAGQAWVAPWRGTQQCLS